VVAQRAENNQKIYKKDNFYIISIEIVFFSLIQELYVPDSFFTYKEGISKFYNCLNNVKGPIKRDYRKIEQIKPVARR
ncbi:hypothetical protein, partial [Staphylococcus epidermidis]|uniref:hypothetical protein n=1 Tax=Staphylococcus epidermidis TaxID=1282 RepID=UPI0028796846